jgi:DNA-binding protein H-NS
LESTNQNNSTDIPMEKIDLEVMSLEELWLLHEQISKILSVRITAQKKELEQRLQQLNAGKTPREAVVVQLKSSEADHVRQRRKYPRVLPKYQNPAVPGETWSGRGKRPRWLVSALKAGGKIEDFEIANEPKGKARAGR